MVNFTEMYFAIKIAAGAIGIALQLILIIIIWINGGFKSK